MLQRLKSSQLNTVGLDELVELFAYATLLITAYEANSLEAPEWIFIRKGELKREIDVKRKDAMEKRLAEARRLRAQFRTPAQKSRDLDKEIKELELALK